MTHRFALRHSVSNGLTGHYPQRFLIGSLRSIVGETIATLSQMPTSSVREIQIIHKSEELELSYRK